MQNELMPKDFSRAIKDIKLAILQSRARSAANVNVEALKLYFYVGGYISQKTRKAKWGTGTIDALSQRLQVELPGLRGFSPSSIKRMRLFFEAWSKTFLQRYAVKLELAPTSEIRPTALGELGQETLQSFLSLGFSLHATILEKTKSENERLYYVQRAAHEVWTHAELLNHLRADDYHHIGILPNNFEKTISPLALASKAVRSFRDEYLLELINLDNVDAQHDEDIDERVLSKNLVVNIEKTIAALGGSDFCFMGREKRLLIEGEELFIDLLFYHRSLQAMVAIELKMGRFRASYLGQLSKYLAVLDAQERKPHENPSIGLLLCEQMNKPIVQLTVQGYKQPIAIATYQALRKIPKPYQALAPIIDGVRRVLAEHNKESKHDALE